MFARLAVRSALAVVVLGACLAAGCGSGDAPPASIGAGGDPANPAAAPANPDDLAASPSYSAPRPEPNPKVIFHTSLGDITVQLDRQNAPITVDNFLSSYVDAKWYDRTVLHYVDKGKLVLGGAFDEQFARKAARGPILNEAHNALANKRGTIAMSRNPDEPISATSEFFFNLADNPELDHKDADSPQAYGYCVFGTVVSGLDVLDKIGGVAVADRDGMPKVPVQPVVILAVERVP